MSGELLFLIEENTEGGYTARAMGDSIFLEADTLEDLHEQIRDCIYVSDLEVETSDNVSMEILLSS